MNSSALPGERLAPLGTSPVAGVEQQLQPSRGLPASNLLCGHRVCTVTPLFGGIQWVWSWGEWAQSRAQPESRI